MVEEVVIFRNVAGEITHGDLLKWKRSIRKLGLVPEERVRGKMTALSLMQQDETITFYLYEQELHYQLHIDYLRIKKGDGRLMESIDLLIQIAGLRGEKYGSGRNHMWRTVYSNGLIMDEGPFVESKEPPDFELRITREALLGHIYLNMDKYLEARSAGESEKEAEIHKTLQELVEQLAKVDQVLRTEKRSSF
ncbi:hypothetical protein [Effusibacillus dendaii]|uniref:Uncharacterized protein n=1 Tax=Effusibacillus dendaii TaxID=2743772 RepID=A0A7I8DCR8_9BACL|nr:hypothetical protein [Effusibacillus dendaii]BCJ86626.1 hypothetical protein skT53_16110 [Effusibacillus dendaii]